MHMRGRTLPSFDRAVTRLGPSQCPLQETQMTRCRIPTFPTFPTFP
jgi:hypothetical protein